MQKNKQNQEINCPECGAPIAISEILSSQLEKDIRKALVFTAAAPDSLRGELLQITIESDRHYTAKEIRQIISLCWGLPGFGHQACQGASMFDLLGPDGAVLRGQGCWRILKPEGERQGGRSFSHGQEAHWKTAGLAEKRRWRVAPPEGPNPGAAFFSSLFWRSKKGTRLRGATRFQNSPLRQRRTTPHLPDDKTPRNQNQIPNNKLASSTLHPICFVSESCLRIKPE